MYTTWEDNQTEQDKKKYSFPQEYHPPEICTKQNTYKKCVYR